MWCGVVVVFLVVFWWFFGGFLVVFFGFFGGFFGCYFSRLWFRTRRVRRVTKERSETPTQNATRRPHRQPRHPPPGHATHHPPSTTWPYHPPTPRFYTFRTPCSLRAALTTQWQGLCVYAPGYEHRATTLPPPGPPQSTACGHGVAGGFVRAQPSRSWRRPPLPTVASPLLRVRWLGTHAITGRRPQVNRGEARKQGGGTTRRRLPRRPPLPSTSHAPGCPPAVCRRLLHGWLVEVGAVRDEAK